MQLPTDDEREAYKRGRAAIKNLTTHDRNFNWWLDYSNAVVTVRTEAMRDAFTNQPIGKAYNAHHARIMKREKLDAFDANTRKDCVAMVDNLHHPVDARRAHGILAWRSGLDVSTRAKLNHPSSILRRWKKDTEPLVEKQAGSFKDPKQSPFLEALGDAELERDEARRASQDLRVRVAELEREIEGSTPAPELDEICSFCCEETTRNSEVLLRGKKALICAGCVEIAMGMLEKRRAEKEAEGEAEAEPNAQPALSWRGHDRVGWKGQGSDTNLAYEVGRTKGRNKWHVFVSEDGADGERINLNPITGSDAAKAAAEVHYAEHLEELR